ncbi:hypothetical protein AgCh_005918 [Apium graveolens]
MFSLRLCAKNPSATGSKKEQATGKKKEQATIPKMIYSIESRSSLPEFYRDEIDKQKKLEVMKDSQFHKLLATKLCNTLIKALNIGAVHKEPTTSVVIPDFYTPLVEGYDKKEVLLSKRVFHELLQKLDIDNASEKENFKKTSEVKNNMDAAIAPYSYYVGRGMSTDDARSLVANAKLEASDRSELQFDLKFDRNIVDNIVNTSVENYAGKILEHCVKQKIGVARSLGIEMSEEALITDLRERYCNSEASNWVLLKALISSFSDRHKTRADYNFTPPRRSDSVGEENNYNLEILDGSPEKEEKNEDSNEGVPLDLDKLDDLEKDSVEEEKNYNLEILDGSPEKKEKNEDLNEGVTSDLVKLNDLEKEAEENNLEIPENNEEDVRLVNLIPKHVPSDSV